MRTIAGRIRQLLTRDGVPILVALDGHSGAGKSTLAAAVAAEVGAVVVDTDDFYAGDPAEVWDTRRVAVERCIDWSRLRREALEPLMAGDMASWHAFDWERDHGLAEELTVRSPGDVVILDGIYSARPELGDLVWLSVLLEAPGEIRRSRVSHRDGRIDPWFDRWDRAERHYLQHLRPRDSFDLVVQGWEPSGGGGSQTNRLPPAKAAGEAQTSEISRLARTAPPRPEAAGSHFEHLAQPRPAGE